MLKSALTPTHLWVYGLLWIVVVEAYGIGGLWWWFCGGDGGAHGHGGELQLFFVGNPFPIPLHVVVMTSYQ